MGQSTEELNAQIEETRLRMTADVDALQDRVSPSAIVERRKEAAKGKVFGVRDKVMGTASDARDRVSSATSSAGDGASSAVTGTQDRITGSPLTAGLVAFGAGLVIASLFPATSTEAEAAHRVVEGAKEKGAPLVDQAKTAAQGVASDVMDSATTAASQVKDTATEAAKSVKEEGQSSAQTVADHASTS